MGFELFGTPRIVFGRGTVSRLPDVVRPLGKKALVVFNGSTQPRVVGLLVSAGIGCVSKRQRGEPKVDDVADGVELARSENCDVLVGLGGGSAVDTAKAVAGVLSNGGEVLDYMEVIGRGRPLAGPAVPWVAVPTTAGTGAEVTRNAVLGDPARRFKASLRSELLLPRVALVDPELGVDGPPAVTAASWMDALCQLVESFTSLNANPVTDALAAKGIELAASSLRRAYADGADLAAREDMALAALMSGITLTNAGLGAVHGFAAPLGAAFPVPHGVVCAALLPHVMAANIAALRAQPGAFDAPESHAYVTLAKYAGIGTILVGPESEHPAIGATLAEAVDLGVSAIAAMVADLRIPPLRDFGVTPAGIPEMVALARKSRSMPYNPVVLSDDALAEALARAI